MAQRRRDDVFSTRHMDTVARKDGGGQTVNIVTYNVLSDKLLFNNPDLYPDRNGPYLNWEYRKGRLLKEILSYKADVMQACSCHGQVGKLMAVQPSTVRAALN
eukprot:scpid50307/ scgid4282/ 